jgi:hypothetical protein
LYCYTEKAKSDAEEEGREKRGLLWSWSVDKQSFDEAAKKNAEKEVGLYKGSWWKDDKKAFEVGLYKLHSVCINQSLAAPGFFQPLSPRSDLLVSTFAFKLNLYRRTPRRRRSPPRRRGGRRRRRSPERRW